MDHTITKNRQVRVLYARKETQNCEHTVARKAAHVNKSKSNQAIILHRMLPKKMHRFSMDLCLFVFGATAPSGPGLPYS